MLCGLQTQICTARASVSHSNGSEERIRPCVSLAPRGGPNTSHLLTWTSLATPRSSESAQTFLLENGARTLEGRTHACGVTRLMIARRLLLLADLGSLFYRCFEPRKLWRVGHSHGHEN